MGEYQNHTPEEAESADTYKETSEDRNAEIRIQNERRMKAAQAILDRLATEKMTTEEARSLLEEVNNLAEAIRDANAQIEG